MEYIAIPIPLHGLALRRFNVNGNQGLGHAGLVALMELMPPTLEDLAFSDTSCGDTGMAAFMSVVPRLMHLRDVCCHTAPGISSEVWAGVWSALPQLTALKCLRAEGCTGMGSAGTRALAVVVPQLPHTFVELDVHGCRINVEAAEILRAAWGPRGNQLAGGFLGYERNLGDIVDDIVPG